MLDNAAHDMQPDRRAVHRDRCLQPGMIVFNDGNSTIDCTVRNRSGQGFKVEIGVQTPVPDEFRLLVGRDAQKYPCSLVWQNGVTFGAEVDPSLAPQPQPDDEAAKAARADADLRKKLAAKFPNLVRKG